MYDLSNAERVSIGATTRRQWLAYAALSACFPGAAFAQAFPTKPIRLVQGFGPGSSIDVVARPLAQELSNVLGQSVLVDSRPGATGTIANEIVVRSPPDGYTLLIAPLAAVVTASHLFPIRYDPMKDLLPVVQVARFDTVLVAGPALAANTVPELLALARAKPGGLTYSSPGIGTGFHLAGELLAQTAGIKLLHVPYGGGGKAVLTDLIAGRVDFTFESLAAVKPLLQSGQLRAIAVTGSARSPGLPNVPTVAETVPGYEIGGWHGVFAPAGTPAPIVAQLNAAIRKALATPALQQLWSGQDLQYAASFTQQEFADRIRSDYARYGKLISSVGIKLQ